MKERRGAPSGLRELCEQQEKCMGFLNLYTYSVAHLYYATTLKGYQAMLVTMLPGLKHLLELAAGLLARNLT